MQPVLKESCRLKTFACCQIRAAPCPGRLLETHCESCCLPLHQMECGAEGSRTPVQTSQNKYIEYFKERKEEKGQKEEKKEKSLQKELLNFYLIE
jgi:hypothetical protein